MSMNILYELLKIEEKYDLSKRIKKGKTTNALMRHMRNEHDIYIQGSKQKQNLLNMGYYHGYKALRFIKSRDDDQKYTDFNEIQYIYSFDKSLKKIFYSSLISIETSLKNRLIDYLIPNKNPSIEYVYNNLLNDYTRFDSSHKKYKKYLNRRLELRQKIDETIAYHYGKGNPIISHFFHNSKPVPLWAYFEIISFGEFGNFIYCLHQKYKIEFMEILKINNTACNQNGRILENMIFALTSLRNAVMHNSIIFDCRFNNDDQSKQIKQYLENMTKVKNIKFINIVDFLVLIIFLLKCIKVPNKELKKIIQEFELDVKMLENNIPRNSYFKILGTDIYNKISQLKEFAD